MFLLLVPSRNIWRQSESEMTQVVYGSRARVEQGQKFLKRSHSLVVKEPRVVSPVWMLPVGQRNDVVKADQ